MKNKWTMFFILLLSSITVALSQLKVAAVMGMASQAFGVTISQASWLMSLFTVAGIVLAIPGAAIMAKIGPKNLLIVLMVCLILGNVMGAITNIFSLVLVSRIIEGISFAMIIMVAIAMINTWFADGGAGTATGIFNTFAAIGNFVCMNVSIPIVNAMGMKSLWWITAAMAAICLILVVMFIKMPEINNSEAQLQEKATIGEAASNKKVWVIAFAQLSIAFILFSFITTYPQLFIGFYGLSPEKANFYASLNGLFGIPACIICGMLVEKTGKPLNIAIIGAIGTLILCIAIPYLSPATFVIHVLVSAICPGGLVLTSIFCIVPQITKRPALIGYTMSFVNLLYYIGVFGSTPVIMGAVEKSGWYTASHIMSIVMGVGLVLLIVVKIMSEKNMKTEINCR